MAVREKVLIGLMIAALCWAGFAFFGKKESQGQAEPAPAASGAGTNMSGVSAISPLLQKPVSSEIIYFLIAKAGLRWESDPFSSGQELAVSQEEEGRTDSPISYSGLVRMQDKAAAIIDGAEYQVGDELGSGSLVVQEVRTNCVVLRHKGTGETSLLYRVEMKP